jgi:hypothetical protein
MPVADDIPGGDRTVKKPTLSTFSTMTQDVVKMVEEWEARAADQRGGNQ